MAGQLWKGRECVETEIAALCTGFLATGSCILSMMQFKEKGICLNNAYLFASGEERKRMNKKAHYRQSGIVFALLTAVFSFLTLEILWETGWLWQIIWGVAAVTVLYAIASSVKSALQ